MSLLKQGRIWNYCYLWLYQSSVALLCPDHKTVPMYLIGGPSLCMKYFHCIQGSWYPDPDSNLAHPRHNFRSSLIHHPDGCDWSLNPSYFGMKAWLQGFGGFGFHGSDMTSSGRHEIVVKIPNESDLSEHTPNCALDISTVHIIPIALGSINLKAFDDVIQTSLPFTVCIYCCVRVCWDSHVIATEPLPNNGSTCHNTNTSP